MGAIPSGRTLAINGCPDVTAGELLGMLPEHGVAGFLLCRADVGAVWVAPTVTDPRFAETAWDVLQRGDDGTWSVAASEVDYTCTDGIAAQACAELGVLDLAGSPPFPSAASIAAFDEAMARRHPARPVSGRGDPVRGAGRRPAGTCRGDRRGDARGPRWRREGGGRRW